MENLEFFKKQLERIKDALNKLDPAKQTQKYVNLMGTGTNLVGFTSQLEGLIKAKEEAAKREAENKKAQEEAMKEIANKEREAKKSTKSK